MRFDDVPAVVAWMPDYQQAVEHMRTLRDLIRWGATAFAQAELEFGHGSDNALDEAAHLAFHTLRLPHHLHESYLDSRLTPAERDHVLERFRARIERRVPAAYLTGEAWFAGLPFTVDESVIIPRSPIAELIEDGFEPYLGEREPERILDLCTGCGAIAIACAYAFPDAYVDATDVDEAALAVARTNVERHALSPRVRVIDSDLFDGLAGERYDLIVTNPPYVDDEELARLPSEYQHEPALAFSGGRRGLDHVARLLRQAPAHLVEDGLLFIEVGNTAAAVEVEWPELPITWVDLERGGVGVGVIEAEDLAAWVDYDRQRAAQG